MARSSGTYSTDEGDTLEGHRLRTIKLRGQVSQGLIIPLPLWLDVSDCGEYVRIESSEHEIDDIVRSIDSDYSDLFGVKKYEKRLSLNLSGFARGNFPSFIPKTDQERIQNLSRNFPVWVADEAIYEMTEKLDGTSCTIYKNSVLLEEGKEALGVCSRNLDLKDTEGNVYWDIAKKYDIHAILLRDGRNLAIQVKLSVRVFRAINISSLIVSSLYSIFTISITRDTSMHMTVKSSVKSITCSMFL